MSTHAAFSAFNNSGKISTGNYISMKGDVVVFYYTLGIEPPPPFQVKFKFKLNSRPTKRSGKFQLEASRWPKKEACQACQVSQQKQCKSNYGYVFENRQKTDSSLFQKFYINIVSILKMGQETLSLLLNNTSASFRHY